MSSVTISKPGGAVSGSIVPIASTDSFESESAGFGTVMLRIHHFQAAFVA